MPDAINHNELAAIPTYLELSELDYQKTDRSLAKSEVCECISILIHNRWLEPHHENLVELWSQCSSVEERLLIKELLHRFDYIHASSFSKECATIAKYLTESWIFNASRTKFVATAERSESDGSQHFLLQLRDALSDLLPDTCFINSITNIEKKVTDGDLIILVDDFTGSATKTPRKINYIKESLLNDKKSSCEIRFISFAGMQAAMQKIENMDIKCYFHKRYNKGIREMSAPEKVEGDTVLMQGLEKKLSPVWMGKNLSEYSFGFGQAESLYFHEGRRIPNNVFPIFWWPYTGNPKGKKPLFPRSRPN